MDILIKVKITSLLIVFHEGGYFTLRLNLKLASGLHIKTIKEVIFVIKKFKAMHKTVQ